MGLQRGLRHRRGRLLLQCLLQLNRAEVLRRALAAAAAALAAAASKKVNDVSPDCGSSARATRAATLAGEAEERALRWAGIMLHEHVGDADALDADRKARSDTLSTTADPNPPASECSSSVMDQLVGLGQLLEERLVERLREAHVDDGRQLSERPNSSLESRS